METYQGIGVMSGTSLDGLDIASCTFTEDNGLWKFEIEAAETIVYTEEWRSRLNKLVDSSGLDLAQADIDFGFFIGKAVAQFIKRTKQKPNFIASHGHTIFHQPQKLLTLQIGNGLAIRKATGVRVINDFRTWDVLHGGQGAPLVPIGDELLFADYDFCLNLGGIGNLSTNYKNKRIAFDICAVNMVLNYLAQKEGKAFDENGNIASGGKLLPDLLNKLNKLPFYTQQPPKSLGYEWFSENVLPLLKLHDTQDLLCTYSHHIAQQLTASIVQFKNTDSNNSSSVLVTGGGAFNAFLIDLLKKELQPHKIEVVVPDKEIINYKEAVIFALLGVLRLRGEANALASVTGASQNTIGGIIYDNV